jgi:hypothetical protein
MRSLIRKRKQLAVAASESRSPVRSEYTPAIEGLQEWLALQLGTPRSATKETRSFHEGRIAGLREAVTWLKKLETASVLARAPQLRARSGERGRKAIALRDKTS